MEHTQPTTTHHAQHSTAQGAPVGWSVQLVGCTCCCCLCNKAAMETDVTVAILS